MTLNDEASVKKALGINSFRELSKEKMLAFAATMPDMAKEVRLKLIEQIPAFRDFALDAVNAAERVFTKSVDANEESRSELHESLAQVREAIKSELTRDDISEEHRRYLTEKLIETGQADAVKDSENKQSSPIRRATRGRQSSPSPVSASSPRSYSLAATSSSSAWRPTGTRSTATTRARSPDVRTLTRDHAHWSGWRVPLSSPARSGQPDDDLVDKFSRRHGRSATMYAWMMSLGTAAPTASVGLMPSKSRATASRQVASNAATSANRCRFKLARNPRIGMC